MKMTKAIRITLACASLACGGLLVLQSSGNRELAERRDAEKASISDLERERRNLETAVADSPFLRALPTEEELREKAAAEVRAATTPAERINRTREKLERLVAGLGNLSEGPGDFFRVLPDILRVVEDLSIEELIEVAEGMGEGKKNDNSPREVTRMILLVLAAEQDPQRVMRNPETMKQRELRDMVLGTLARRDPAAARRWVENSDMNENEKKEFAGTLAFRTLREDVTAGLKLLREAKLEDGRHFGPFGTVPLPAEKIPDLLAAMAKPENEDMRDTLRRMVVGSAVLDGGLVAVREQVEAMELGKEELNAFFRGDAQMLLESQPAELLGWVQEVRSREEQAELLSSMIGSWARRDFNAAGEWLGKMESSPGKDAAVQSYVQTIVRVDPRAAMVWAGTIEDERGRTTATVRAVEQWINADKAAAEKWMGENGVDLEGLRKTMEQAK